MQIRRVYDVSNVLCSLSLINKVVVSIFFECLGVIAA
jgi:hypothetical protein